MKLRVPGTLIQPRPQRVPRPFGVKAIVVLLLVSALLTAVTGGWGFVWAMGGNSALLNVFPEPAPLVLTQFALLVVEGVADLVAAVGLLLMRRWAWVLVMLLVGYRMASNLWLYISGANANEIEMILDVVIVFYLNQRDVQRAFGYGGGDRQRTTVPVQRAP